MRKTLGKIPLSREKAYRYFYFLAWFGAIKLSSVVASLFTSNFVKNNTDYGVFEYGLTFGLIASIVTDMGGNGSFPYFYLNQEKKDYESVFFFHFLPVALVCIIASFFVTSSPALQFALLVTFIAAVQTRLSTIYKTKGQPYISVLADGGLFIVVNIYNAWLYTSGSYFNIHQLSLLLLVYSVLLFFFTMLKAYQLKADFSFQKYLATLKWGGNIVVAAFLIIFLTNSARLIIESTLGYEFVGRYGFFFRIASFVVLLHQAVYILFFRNIYTTEVSRLDKYLSVFLGVVLLANVCVWLLAPYLLKPYLKMLAYYTNEDKLLFITLCFQVFFWISMAAFENIIYREELSKKMNIFYLALLVLFFGSCYTLWYQKVLTVNWVAIINLITLFLCVEVQHWCFKTKRLVFRRARNIHYFAGAFFVVLYLLIEG